MSRYAVTYRIDGGPGLNGWAERTCHGVSVYANKDDMTPVSGATIVTYSDVPTEVHVVPTTKDCNGDGSTAVYDKCAVNLLEQIERNTRMATTAPTTPTTQPATRYMFIANTGAALKEPVVRRFQGTPYSQIIYDSFDAQGTAQFSSKHSGIRPTATGDIVRIVLGIIDQELTSGVSMGGGVQALSDGDKVLKVRAAVSSTIDYTFNDATEPFYDVAFSGERQMAMTQLTGNAPAGHYAIIEIMGSNISFYDGATGVNIVATPAANAVNLLVPGRIYAFRKVNPLDDFTNVGAPVGATSGVFTATSDGSPAQWDATYVWDVTNSIPSVAYNTTGSKVTANIVVIGEDAKRIQVGVKIRAYNRLFGEPASTVQVTNMTMQSAYDLPLKVLSATEVLAPLGGKVLYETFKLQEK